MECRLRGAGGNGVRLRWRRTEGVGPAVGRRGPRPPVLDLDAAHLSPEHGEFDLAFSVHVLEHVSDLAGVITAVQGRLRPTGHGDPHLSQLHRALRATFRGASRADLPCGDEACSARSHRSFRAGGPRSNFVTARSIRRMARSAVAIRRRLRTRGDGCLREASRVRRELQTSVKGFAGKLAAFAVASRPGSWLIERWPAALSTPMVFTLSGAPAEQRRHSDQSESSTNAAMSGSAT